MPGHHGAGPAGKPAGPRDTALPAEFTLRLCLPRTDADNAARLLDLQTWAATESAAGRGPVLGNAGREVLRTEQGRMERADAGGTAVYTVRLQAEYTQVYTEETT